METFNSLIYEMEKDITDELNKMSEGNPNESLNESVDNIKLSLSSRLSELRLLVTDKIRLRQALINPSNRLNMIDNQIVILINGTGNTTRVNAKFIVVWNTSHTLNISLPNPIAIKTRENSMMLALLATCKQMAQLRIKDAVILSPWQKMKRTIESLPLWRAQGFRSESGAVMPDSNLLEMIDDVINNNSLKLNVIQPQSPNLVALYDSLLDVSKKMITGTS